MHKSGKGFEDHQKYLKDLIVDIKRTDRQQFKPILKTSNGVDRYQGECSGESSYRLGRSLCERSDETL